MIEKATSLMMARKLSGEGKRLEEEGRKKERGIREREKEAFKGSANELSSPRSSLLASISAQ